MKKKIQRLYKKNKWHLNISIMMLLDSLREAPIKNLFPIANELQMT